jgi:hypothetical protein
MPKIQCKVSLKDLLGKEISTSAEDKAPFFVGQAIANILLAPRQGERKLDALKSWELAQKFYNNKEVEIDTSDFQKVKEMVETDKNYSMLIIGQLMEILTNLK